MQAVATTRVDYGGGAGAYRRARALPPEVLAQWGNAVGSVGITARRVLDLGAGPGGFLEPLQAWLHAGTVVAVEPSSAMRDEATTEFPYVAAVAEALPFGADRFDAVWISTAVHQFDDLAAAAGEVRRVIRRGGHVLVRGFFADVEMTGTFALFPGIDRAAATFPPTRAVTSAFEAAGFELDRVVDVVEPWRFDVDAWVARVRSVRTTDSLLRVLTDDEVEAGLERVVSAAVDGTVQSDLTLRLLHFA